MNDSVVPAAPLIIASATSTEKEKWQWLSSWSVSELMIADLVSVGGKSLLKTGYRCSFL